MKSKSNHRNTTNERFGQRTDLSTPTSNILALASKAQPERNCRHWLMKVDPVQHRLEIIVLYVLLCLWFSRLMNQIDIFNQWCISMQVQPTVFYPKLWNFTWWKWAWHVVERGMVFTFQLECSRATVRRSRSTRETAYANPAMPQHGWHGYVSQS